MKSVLFFFLSSFCFFANAQQLSLQQIMDDPVWIGRIPSNLSISPKGDAIYFDVTTKLGDVNERLRYDVASGNITPLTDAERHLSAAGSPWVEGATRLYQISGDIWVHRDGDLHPLISRSARVSLVSFINENEFVFREGNQLHHFDLRDGSSRQLTDLSLDKEKKDKETIYTTEERKMFWYIDFLYRRDESREQQRDAARNMGPLSKPDKVYLDNKSYRLNFGPSLTISSDLKYVAAAITPKESGKRTDYADFITKEGNVTARKARARVGIQYKTDKLAVINRESGEVSWLDLKDLPEIATDRLADIKEGLSEEEKKWLPKTKEGPRPVFIRNAGFSKNGTLLVNILAVDYKDNWIIAVNPESMEWDLVDHHYDEAWQLNLPSPRWNKAGDRAIFMSDKSGHQHLYHWDAASKKSEALTSGSFQVYGPETNEAGDRWYFHANKTHPGERHFYSMDINGGEMTAHTKKVGQHRVVTSEDGSVMAALFSQTNRPPILRVKQGKGRWKDVYDGRSDAFKAIKWVKPEVLTYTNRDGNPVYARLYKPKKPNGAGVIFVHGAGYLQNAHKGWSGYYREYMFHNLLLSKGYTVLDPDFQASAGYGRDWRTAIYRHMGGADLNDIVDGAKFMSSEHGVDAKRIGLYGGSYGGFISLMAMFTASDYFQAGAALRPVTDWAYYNHWYTSRILNLPANDPEAYRKSSPIYHAEGLKGHLLIAHGMIDDNVHYQDSVRLAQKLIELRKDKWELSSYPAERHGFITPTGWYDEYRRIYELFERSLHGQ